MSPEDVGTYRRMTEQYSFDYVLGSMHVIDHMDIYDDILYRDKSKQEVYARYFDATMECLEVYDFIDSLGHIDYIARYARFPDREIYYDHFADRIDQILATLAAGEKCLEINTRRLGDAQVVAHLLPIYKRFYELGGRWVTVGSDAHQAGDIGKNFSTAIQIADYCNLRPVWFDKRRIQYI